MDWFAALWSPLWFCWDLANNAIILLKTRQWVRGSVHDTKEQVIDLLLEPETTDELKKALDIPSKADLDTINTQVSGLKAELAEELAELKAGLTELQTALKNPPAIELDAEGIAEHLKKSLAGTLGGDIKVQRGEARHLAQEATAEYVNSPEWEEENADNIRAVEGLTGSHGMAKALVKRGPRAVDGWARANLSKARYDDFRAVYEEIQAERSNTRAVRGVSSGW